MFATTTQKMEEIRKKKLAGEFENTCGRASGWRDNGKNVTAIIDPDVWKDIKETLIYQPTEKPDDELGNLIEQAIEDPKNWFKNRDYRIAAFLADCNIDVRNMQENDYKRVVRIIKALRTLIPPCRKLDSVLDKLDSVIDDIFKMIGNVLAVTAECSIKNEYKVSDLGFDNRKCLPILRSLGVFTKLYCVNKINMFYMNNEKRAELIELKKGLEKELYRKYGSFD